VFRAQFHQMCAHAGVDPLASNKVKQGPPTQTWLWVFAAWIDREQHQSGVGCLSWALEAVRRRARRGGLS